MNRLSDGLQRPQTRTIFVGRELERFHLLRAVERAARGSGGVILVAGEAGAGKSRLVNEIAQQAAKLGVGVLVGHCSESEGAPPYVGFVEILETLIAREPDAATLKQLLGDGGPELAKLAPVLRRRIDNLAEPVELPPELERRYLLNSACDFIGRVAQRRPQVAILEDVHQGDRATLSLLEHLARRLDDTPLLMIATLRDGPVDVSDALAAMIEWMLRERLAHRLELGPLGASEVIAMLRAMSGQDPPKAIIQTILEETEGNPFFIEEVFNYLTAEGKLFDSNGRFRSELVVGELEVPHGVRLTLESLLKRLTPEAARLLTIAATVGRRFEFNLMRTVSGTSSETLVDRLDELIRARFIEPAPDAFGASFEFSHELIRQTVLGSLSQPRRQQLHLQLAEAIEQLPADRIDDRMLDLARHFYQAGPLADPARASECLTRAGERYLTASAFEEALRCFDRALALRSQTDSTLAEIKYKRGIAQRSLGLWDEALRSWEQSLTTYEALNEFEAAGRICAALNTQLSWAGRWIEAIKMGARGLALLGDRSSADRCRLLAANGATLGLAGHHDAGLAMINQSLAMAAEIGEPRLKGLAMYALVLHHYAYMRTRSSLETCLAAIEQLNPVSDGWLTTDLMIFVIEAHLSFGQFEQMALSLAELKPLASRLGHFVALISATRDEKSRDLISSGDIASWKEFLLGDLKECERIQNPAISAGALSALGVIEMWRGDWAEARVHMKEGEAREPAGPLGGDWVTIAMHDVYSGRHAQALALLERRRREFPRADQPNSRAAWMVMLSAVEVFFVAGEPRSAAEFYPMVLEAIESGVMFRAFDFRLLETVAGIAATAGRDWPAAERHFRRAIHICDALPHRIEQPEVRRFYAQMLLQRGQPGDRETACKLLREAIGAYAEIGMPKHREMAKVLLNSLESPPPAWAPKIVESSFRREGQYWTIAFEGRVVRLKDTKGLRDIVNLLASPGKALHVVELMAASVGEVPVSRVGTSAAALAQDGLSTAGRSSEPSIDTRARQAYRERLNDLRIELDDAERMGDAVVAEHARKEMEQITEHLILAFGLTGLARGADDPIERARIAVRVRIQSALKRIREEHPVLGRHLAHAVKTGTFCTYEAELPQRWEISA